MPDGVGLDVTRIDLLPFAEDPHRDHVPQATSSLRIAGAFEAHPRSIWLQHSVDCRRADLPECCTGLLRERQKGVIGDDLNRCSDQWGKSPSTRVAKLPPQHVHRSFDPFVVDRRSPTTYSFAFQYPMLPVWIAPALSVATQQRCCITPGVPGTEAKLVEHLALLTSWCDPRYHRGAVAVNSFRLFIDIPISDAILWHTLDYISVLRQPPPLDSILYDAIRLVDSPAYR